MRQKFLRGISLLPLLLVLLSGAAWTPDVARLVVSSSQDSQEFEDSLELQATPARVPLLRRDWLASFARFTSDEQVFAAGTVPAYPRPILVGHKLSNGLNAPLRT